MEVFVKVIILAVIQGLAEFLPISSSGHLVLAGHFLKVDSAGPFLEVCLHVGTLLSILFYYRRRIGELLSGLFRFEKESRNYVLYVVVASIPAAVAYKLFGDWLESSFDQPVYVSYALMVTGVVVLSQSLARSSGKPLGWLNTFVVGVAQAVALMPGISRSGSTITAARFLGIAPEKAAEFSLLMSVPAVAGAALIEFLKHRQADLDIGVSMLVAGVIVSFVVGYFAIGLLVKSLVKDKIWIFGAYCLIAGVIARIML